MKKELTFKDVFKFPLYVDDYAYGMVYDSNDVHVLDMKVNDYATSKTIVDILNGDCKGKMTGKLSYNNGDIYLNDKIFMRIQGVDFCLRYCDMNLSMEEAANILDEFGNWICKKLQE